MGYTSLLTTILILYTEIQPAHLQYYTTDHVEEPFDIRVVDGPTPLEGRLEVHHDGFWGTVCDHNTEEMQFNVAEVVCKNLGYDTALEVKTDAFYGEGNGNIILSDVVCDGSEQLLSQCRYLSWGGGNCRSDEAFGVRCTNVKDGEIPIQLYPTNRNKYKGLIKAFYNDTWGYICYDYQWGISEANVACRQLGFSAGAISSYHDHRHYGDDAKIVISHVSCITGMEDNLGMCTVHGIDVKESDVYFTTPWYDHWSWVTEGPSVCPSGGRSGVLCNKSETGLSDGKIAGVIVACILLVITLVAVPFIIIRYKKPKDPSSGDTAFNMPSTTQSLPIPQPQSMDVNSTRATSSVFLPNGSPSVVNGQNGRIIYVPHAMSMQQQMNSQSQSIVPVIVSPISVARYASNAQQPVVSNPTALNTTDSEPEKDCSSSNEDAISANMQGVDFQDQTPLIST